MTNREHLISLLQRMDKDACVYLNRLFGCSHISSEECINYDKCWNCWKHWLESEVYNNDHA